MSVKLITLKCPECGSLLDIEEGREFIYCSYCGAKVLIDNENEHIYRHIDEAGIKHEETERMVRLKQIEMAEKKREAAHKALAFKIKASIILILISIAMMILGQVGPLENLSLMAIFPMLAVFYIWIFTAGQDEHESDDSQVRVPLISDYQKNSYETIEERFRNAGFLNVKCVPLNDLSIGLFQKPDLVDSITINGHSVTTEGKKYPPNVPVVISYHSFS